MIKFKQYLNERVRKNVTSGKYYTIKLQELIVHRNALYKSFSDIDAKPEKRTRSKGRLEVWYVDEENKFQLTDGYHRLVELLLTGVKSVKVKVMGTGYGSYYAIADENDRLPWNMKSKYPGLEDLADEDILDELKEKLGIK